MIKTLMHVKIREKTTINGRNETVKTNNQRIVCLFIYLVILGGNFNLNFLGLLNEKNLLLNEFDPLLILYSYRFVPRKRTFFL